MMRENKKGMILSKKIAAQQPERRLGYLYYKILQENTKNNNLPTLDELKSDYIEYLLRITGYDLKETVTILNLSKSDPEPKTRTV